MCMVRHLGFLALALVYTIPAVAQGTNDRFCSVTGLEGIASAQAPSGPTRQVFADQPISADERIVTGAESRLEILCDDGIRITVGPQTELDLTNLVGSGQPETSIMLRLLGGIAGFLAPEGNRTEFEVETDLAIASVRSTEWIVESSSETGTAVFVASGVVEVTTAVNSYVLSESEGIDVAPNSSASAVSVWGPARVERSRDALGFTWR